jgi:hypothetical protein
MRLDQSVVLNQNNVKGWNKNKLDKNNIKARMGTMSNRNNLEIITMNKLKVKINESTIRWIVWTITITMFLDCR